jgi:flagellar assembly protein FliH
MIIKKRSQNLGEEKKVIQEVVEQTTSVEVSENFETEIEEQSFQTIEQTIQEQSEPEIDLFDIENIDFTQRQERRRGSRRRGYRRIDDRNLVSRAQEESESIKKSAFEEGYRLGLEKAQVDIDKFKNELVNFMNAKQDVFEYIAPDILEISVNIAKTIIKKELEADPQVLINTIVDVLKTVSKSEPKVTIKVRPQSVQFIKDTIPNITYQYGIESKINIIADPSIEEGGCVLQTNNGIVDASIDTQIEIIKKALEINS